MKGSLYALNSDRTIMCYPNRRNEQSLSNEILIEEEKIEMDAREVKLFSITYSRVT